MSHRAPDRSARDAAQIRSEIMGQERAYRRAVNSMAELEGRLKIVTGQDPQQYRLGLEDQLSQLAIERERAAMRTASLRLELQAVAELEALVGPDEVCVESDLSEFRLPGANPEIAIRLAQDIRLDPRRAHDAP
ncbi:MAG: hypothetical protein AB7P08_10390 [Burkholderiales bacterium]